MNAKMWRNSRVWIYLLLIVFCLFWLLLSWKLGLFSANSSGEEPSTWKLLKVTLRPQNEGVFEARSNDDENDEQYEKRIVIGKVKKTYRNWHKSVFPELPPRPARQENRKLVGLPRQENRRLVGLPRQQKRDNFYDDEELLRDGGKRVRKRKETKVRDQTPREMMVRDNQAIELNVEVLKKLEKINQHTDRAQMAAKLIRPKRRFSRKRREVEEAAKALARRQPARAGLVHEEVKQGSDDPRLSTTPAERNSSSAARAHPQPKRLEILTEKVRTHVEKTTPSTYSILAATALPGKSPTNDFENIRAEDVEKPSLVADLNAASPSSLGTTADSAKTIYEQESRPEPKMSLREMSSDVLQRSKRFSNTELRPVSSQNKNLTKQSSFSQTDVAREFVHHEVIQARRSNSTVKVHIGLQKPNKSIHTAEQYIDRKKLFGKDPMNDYKGKLRRRDLIDITRNDGTKENGRDVTKSSLEIEEVINADKIPYGFLDNAEFENNDDANENTKNNLTYYYAEDYDENLVKRFRELLYKSTSRGPPESSSVDDYDPVHLEMFQTLLLRQQESSWQDTDFQQSLNNEAGLHATNFQTDKFRNIRAESDLNNADVKSSSGLKKSASRIMPVDPLNEEQLPNGLDPAAARTDVTGDVIVDEDGDAIADEEDLSGVRPAIFSRRRRSVEKVETFLAPTLPMQNRITITVTLMTGQAWSQDRPLGGQVELDCHNSVLAAIRSEVPTVRLQWLFNGQPVPFKPSRMLLRRDDLLLIQDLRYGDTGLYECLARYGGEGSAEQVVPAAFFALAVTGDLPSLVVRQGDNLTLACHAHPLAMAWKQAEHTVTGDETLFCRPPGCMVHNFTDRAVYSWFHNDNESDLLPGGTLDTHRPQMQKLGPATLAMAGVWRCQARHVTSGRVWTTNWYRVHVKDPPSFLECAWNVLLQSPGLAAMLGLLTVGICLVLSLSLARQAQKSDEQVEERWQAMKKRMLHRSTTRGAELATSPSLESLIGSDGPQH